MWRFKSCKLKPYSNLLSEIKNKQKYVKNKKYQSKILNYIVLRYFTDTFPLIFFLPKTLSIRETKKPNSKIYLKGYHNILINNSKIL